MSEAFLGVNASISGRRWVARPFDPRVAETMVQRFGMPDILARCLNARGVGLDDTAAFMAPRLRDALPNPSRFKDMDIGAARLTAALRHGEKIAVYGDYDVDGATSAALLLRFLRSVGAAPELYVPDRIREGYGPNADAMRHLAAAGVKLTICVDCGTTAHEPLAAARDAGMDVIVLDHHASEPVLPPAVAVINPNRLDEDGDYGYLAAVGVTYLFVIAATRALRADGYFNDKPEPDLMRWLDLVALGTICDVVQLIGLNRAFVSQGLKVAARRDNTGLNALARVASVRAMDAYAAGFVLGPRINAGGRVGEATLGARLLSTDDVAVAEKLAQHLHELNAERRVIEAQVLIEADHIVMDEKLPLAFAASEKWHPGVIGIVASRLKDKYRHPALVVALEGDIGPVDGRG